MKDSPDVGRQGRWACGQVENKNSNKRSYFYICVAFAKTNWTGQNLKRWGIWGEGNETFQKRLLCFSTFFCRVKKSNIYSLLIYYNSYHILKNTSIGEYSHDGSFTFVSLRGIVYVSHHQHCSNHWEHVCRCCHFKKQGSSKNYSLLHFNLGNFWFVRRSHLYAVNFGCFPERSLALQWHHMPASRSRDASVGVFFFDNRVSDRH